MRGRPLPFVVLLAFVLAPACGGATSSDLLAGSYGDAGAGSSSGSSSGSSGSSGSRPTPATAPR
jgi:hypothetical protein